LNATANWIRALPRRCGKRTLIALALIAVVGLGVRAYVVVDPVENPTDDSHAYYALAKALYEEGSFGGPGFRDSSDWSPGAPLLYAASFYATGGAREGTARIVEALLGVAAIFVVFALGRRLGETAGPRAGPRLGSAVGLLAAFAVAVYPPFIHSTGELMSEPPAILTLPAAVLAFLWASEQQRLRAWLLPGLLFGLTAMFRPEYLFVGVAFVLLAAFRVALPVVAHRHIAEERRPERRAHGWKAGLAGGAVMLAALLLPIVPWTIRNVDVLGRVVPISTGSGKALYVGTYLPADGEYQRVKALLVQRYEGRDLAPGSAALDAVDPTPLFDRVAGRYPELSRDTALGRIGKENFSTYFGDDPVGYLAMTARKVGRMWSSGVGEAMSSGAGRAVQILLVALGLAGFALLGRRGRWWDLVALATPIVLVTAIGAASLAAPRRNEVLMTLVFPLAALALSSGVAAISSAREWSPQQASSRPN
jgi:4-amino-4-deoxy-L-arabinose transferase-like glycosyltransferase